MTAHVVPLPGACPCPATEAPDESRQEIHANIRKLYEDGTPFFTKEAIRDLSNKLKAMPTVGSKIHVTDLYGKKVEIIIEGGDVMEHPNNPRLEMVMSGPRVVYAPLEHLVSTRFPNQRPYEYCPLRIGYPGQPRDKLTKQPIAPNSLANDKVRAGFEIIRNHWNNSQACAQLKARLNEVRPQYNNIVGFALASPSVRVSCMEAKDCNNSNYQHALLLTLRDILSTGDSKQNKIPVYAEDPAYTEDDKSMLNDYGVTVLDNPDGFLQVDDATAVVSIHPDVCVKSILADIAQPALIIWSHVGQGEGGDTDPNSPRVIKMMKDYECFEFPQQKHIELVVIYVKRSAMNAS